MFRCIAPQPRQIAAIDQGQQALGMQTLRGGNDFRGQGRPRCLHVPPAAVVEQLEIIPKRLLVEARLGPAGLVSVENARVLYKVAVDTNGIIDEPATQEMRA